MAHSRPRCCPKKTASRRSECAGWNCGARREATGRGPDAGSLLSKHRPLASRRADAIVDDRDDVFDREPEGEAAGPFLRDSTREAADRLRAPRAREVGD